jgi:hypothetical protein
LVWERDAYLLLVDHVAKESEVLGRHDELMTGAAPHVRFVLRLIAEDEARHHAVFEQWAETFKGFATLVAPPDDGVPRLVAEGHAAQLVGTLEELLAMEKEDAKQLKGPREAVQGLPPHDDVAPAGRADGARHAEAHRDPGVPHRPSKRTGRTPRTAAGCSRDRSHTPTA